MTDDAQYIATASTRTTDVSLRWSITQLFAAMHAVAIPFVITQLEPRSFLYGVACFIGGNGAVLWIVVLHRISTWIEYWSSKLNELEQSTGPWVRVFGDEFQVMHHRGSPSRFVLTALVFVTVFIWVVLCLLYFLG